MKNMTPKFVSISLSLLFGGLLMAQTGNIAINNTGAAPDPSAILDVSSTTSGMLIPRMTLAQRNALTPVAGLTIYQTNSGASDPKGFWVWINAGTGWTQLVGGDDAWQLTGNNGTTPGTNFLGTTDNTNLIFRTNNLVRGGVSNTGLFKVGDPATLSPENLQVDGAIRIMGANATNDAGVIRWDATNSVHQGNVDGTAGGWIDLENRYLEVKNVNYTSIAGANCGNGSAGIPTAVANVPLTISANAIASPLRMSTGGQRKRTQYIFRRSELDLGLAQLSDPSRTEGICPGQPINSIAFWLDSWTGAPGAGLILKVTVRHTSLNAFGAAFDNGTDPAATCAQYSPLGGNLGPTFTPTTGWQTFNFSPTSGPFVWNGIDNVLVEFVMMQGSNTPTSVARFASQNATGFNSSFSRYGGAANPGCGNTSPGAACAPATFPVQGAEMLSTCGAGGASQVRPVIRWNGVVDSRPIPGIATSDYVLYEGGLAVETTPGWACINTGSAANFQGPGTVVAENGVYAGGVRLNDHVFDRYFDGRVAAKEADQFGDIVHVDMDEMSSFIEERRHLPTMKGRLDWERSNGFSIDDLTGQLWMTAETQALYLTEMHDKVQVLEMLSTDRPLSQDEFKDLKQGILMMEELTDGEKQTLINKNKARINCQ